jgi:hypothetical protein
LLGNCSIKAYDSEYNIKSEINCFKRSGISKSTMATFANDAAVIAIGETVES